MFGDLHHFQQLSSCIGSNSCGIGAPVTFGAVSITSTNVGETWLTDDQVATMTGSDQGMYNSYASISAAWSDTTAMDNLRAADITATSVAGSLETIGANTATTNVRGGHSVHTASGSTYGA
jgi:hypothetical protein